VQVTPNLLNINITEEYEQPVTIANYSLDINVLKSSANLKSNTLLTVMCPDNFTGDLETKHLINMSKITKDQKIGNVLSSNLQLKKYGDVFIFVKNINGTFEDHDIIFYTAADLEQSVVVSNETFEINDYTEFSHLQLVDTISISENTTYNDDEYYKFNVSTEEYVDELYLEQIRGIIDRTRVKLTSGQGSFRVLKSSLESGDELKVKAGFASYPGLTYVSKIV
jgi:hypothetical protein